jgi:hypothetical protein
MASVGRGWVNTSLCPTAACLQVRLGLTAAEQAAGVVLALAPAAAAHLDYLAVHARHARQVRGVQQSRVLSASHRETRSDGYLQNRLSSLSEIPTARLSPTSTLAVCAPTGLWAQESTEKPSWQPVREIAAAFAQPPAAGASLAANGSDIRSGEAPACVCLANGDIGTRAEWAAVQAITGCQVDIRFERRERAARFQQAGRGETSGHPRKPNQSLACSN